MSARKKILHLPRLLNPIPTTKKNSRGGSMIDPKNKCSVPSCDGVKRQAGLCDAHVNRKRKGLPMDPPIRRVKPTRKVGHMRGWIICRCGDDVQLTGLMEHLKRCPAET